jgi:hypothetical protein
MNFINAKKLENQTLKIFISYVMADPQIIQCVI